MPIESGDRSDCRVQTVAISCERNHVGGLHVGFLYEREDGSIWKCDLAWEAHGRNFRINALSGMFWNNLGLTQQNLDILAAKLELLCDVRLHKMSIPYDVRFIPGHQYIDANTWSYTSREHGLTCATFILAVLSSFSFDLLVDQPWPSREEDGPALERLIKALEEDGIPEARITEMRANHNNIRYRPEEICGAAATSPWPVPFSEAERLGVAVKASVLEDLP